MYQIEVTNRHGLTRKHPVPTRTEAAQWAARLQKLAFSRGETFGSLAITITCIAFPKSARTTPPVPPRHEQSRCLRTL